MDIESLSLNTCQNKNLLTIRCIRTMRFFIAKKPKDIAQNTNE